MPDPKLNQHLTAEPADRAAAQKVSFAVNTSGKVRCFDRVSNVVGLGRTPLQAFLDWEAKTTPTGKKGK